MAPATGGQRVGACVLWVILGAVVGFLACYPLGILMVGSAKATIGIFQDRTLPVFVPLASLAGAAIPFAAILRARVGRGEDWRQLLRQSVIVAVIATLLSSLLAIIIFGIVRRSLMFAHDGVADCFMLSIPVITALAVVISQFVVSVRTTRSERREQKRASPSS